MIVHENIHATQIEAVCLGYHPLPESICDVVRTEESRGHHEEVKWHQRESDGEPPLQDDTLVPCVRTLAAGENAPRVTRLRDRGQHERAGVSAALELVLDGQ